MPSPSIHGSSERQRWRSGALPLTCLGVTVPLCLALGGGCEPAGGAQDPVALEVPGPGASVPDRFHPEGAPPAGGARDGGRAVVHLESPLPSFNCLIDNAGVTRRLSFELHEGLVQRDWETWELRPRLARAVVIEDTLVRKDGRRLYGRVERHLEPGEFFTVSPSDGHGGAEQVSLLADEVAEVLPETVFTFHLRDDVRWHDGHPFDADDVMFTFRCTKNPHVPCDAYRFSFDKLERAEKLGPHTVRFYLGKPYFQALSTFGGLTIQPAHLFDLTDPDHAERREQVSDEEQGRYLVEHPANQHWIGLGPYRVTDVTDTFIDAERFEDYFDAERNGRFDAVRWRIIRDDHSAFLALLNGEVDFTARLLSEDYFGERVRSDAFRERFYTGLMFTPVMSYTVWNTQRAPFDDQRVRSALSMCFDWEAFIAGFYKGLATRVTSEIYPGSPHYDEAVEPLPFDPEAARELLADAGWYDRDGDGLIDRDGRPLEIELLLPGGSVSALAYGQKLKEELGRVGVELSLISRDVAVFFDRVGARDFDAAHLAWFMPVISDPEQLWHSRWVGPYTGNQGSFADPEADRLIEALQVETDEAQRVEYFHRLQRLVHGQQVYSYGVHVPRKFAAARRLRNVQTFAIEPGYSLRRWYLEGD